ncbi:hypothetical protein FB451DRAFT_1254118 [Mycena latifolia]|nr:hypothetical protein FB451DRAFT_1254118 [Mycena latifolia]
MLKKEGVLHSRTQITSHIRSLQIHKFVSLPRSAPTRGTSISARRLGHDMPSLQNHLSFNAYRDPPPVLCVKTPHPNLIPPSKFSTPFTPVNQVLHTPFQPPEPHKGTPSKRHRNRNWQWSPVLVPRLTSPGFDENTSLRTLRPPPTLQSTTLPDVYRSSLLRRRCMFLEDYPIPKLVLHPGLPTLRMAKLSHLPFSSAPRFGRRLPLPRRLAINSTTCTFLRFVSPAFELAL